jgi:hypothetical protein
LILFRQQITSHLTTFTDYLAQINPVMGHDLT